MPGLVRAGLDVGQKTGNRKAMVGIDKQAAVAGLGLFSGLASDKLAKLAAVAELRRREKGRLLFRTGEPADGFYGVAAGKVRIYRSSPSGKEHILHVFGPGEAFAEVVVFQGGVFPADAQTLEDSELLFFSRQGFLALLRDDPELAMAMLALLSSRLRIFVQKIEELSLKEVPARLAAHLLLLHAAQKKRRLDLELPKGQLAGYLGTIPETLSRVLRRMVEDGLITLDGQAVILRDVDRLAEVASGASIL
ncbi:Crp/Fnr family transcriptional regulator [Desulfolutivibrio sulfoxidireducens]|uniref:Crp/Fnr family transcriptional regulator n=1 Tax=Desulfolutivibrio sulfoxidireducens TaxID=2773299 RepID=UPI00308458A9